MRKSVNLLESMALPVVNHGAVAIQSLSSGRKVPVLVIDTKNRPDIRDLIAIHEKLMPGDVDSSWCAVKGEKDRLVLLLNFSRPSRIDMCLSLDLETYGSLIEGILHSHLLIIQPLHAGLGISDGIEESIYVEIGATDFPVDWRKWYRKIIERKLKKMGLPRKTATHEANRLIESRNKFWFDHPDFDRLGKEG